VENLNQLVADTMTLRDMYKKHHWQVAGPTFYQLHLLYDKHFDEQSELVDSLAERIQSLGGVSIAMAHDVAETNVDSSASARPAASSGAAGAAAACTRDRAARSSFNGQAAAEAGDDGTNDLLVSDVIRTNEMQVWFVSEHLVDSPLL